ncbi:hypothetical protein HDU76_005554, partial [Blyttiomyces sp. JEL0837]
MAELTYHGLQVDVDGNDGKSKEKSSSTTTTTTKYIDASDSKKYGWAGFCVTIGISFAYGAHLFGS